MRFILTDKEKKAATWSELDDAALGKVVKAAMVKIQNVSDEEHKLHLMSAAILLCSFAVAANAAELKLTVDGLTVKGLSYGDWAVAVKKI